MPEVVTFTALELTGRSRGHIVEVAWPRCALHHAVVAPFLALRAAAADAGIDLNPVSSFRDFERQLAIWNAKCRGERDLLDRDGQVLDFASLDEGALVSAILNWSALPGASRHHWGTDFDVIDAAAVPEGYEVQLVPGEYAAGGVFETLNEWLSSNAAGFGFYRPYVTDRGGYRPEPWHLSYAPVANVALRGFSVSLLEEAMQGVSLGAANTVQQRLPEIVERYVHNVDLFVAPGLIEVAGHQAPHAG
jgi:LAS superfamily LD-carboxypeptidase LdcB